MSAVRWLTAPAPLFPWPESPHVLVDEVLGRKDALCPPANRRGVAVAAAAHAAWNRSLLEVFERAAGDQLPARACVVKNAMTEHVAALDGAGLTEDGLARRYDVFLVKDDGATWTLEELRARAVEVRMELSCGEEIIRAQGYGPPPHVVALPRSAPWVAHVVRWPHLLWLLQGAPFAERAARLGTDVAHGAPNVVGRNVRIHRTALVEGSVLEDGVEVDAHATVVGAWLGKDVRVADHSAVHHCVVGPRCHTLGDTFLRRVVAMPGSTLSNIDLREVVLGREVFITAGVIFFTGMPGKNAPFGQSAAEERDSGHAELGGAVGHRCVLGTRAIFEPGRALPGGVVIVMRPEEGVMHVPPDMTPGTVVAWDKAGLARVKERWPGHQPPELDDPVG